ncbi:unnamed protein product [Arabidopsis lyrata]|uniref:DUF3741 domain-containing protein n=1 Tax=Arabidopsis lyrata subsp. lyrata TaxID=81972 RepID=D7L568_ARALL|nr:uncharacterized protein LOC9321731 [Arabidopsis lyrata subsp. lyrata]XP_020888853.1 uncharacterized protein LOC9321731 [Arabidopsis lyrata subsp. lyrata]EFH59798.1 hypothetical protein ARALYDRAFT_342635 [Arabidopsis lyrata subsp. lyrata]CAH8261739.1 unnamed protein product [Arabidopsis lyrata]|eukprot:XP_002883539.1 uncharacterized protein LOC9321731 [Arabidopsis lyrata subsp. lyrata]
MPEGKLRSGVYRSFIMCDDPRDVVECGAIKKQSKSRSSSTKQRCEEHLSKAKERSEMAVAPRKSNTEDVPPSSFQLLRVSKGIQKLNGAIESWSKGFSFEAVSRPEDIAKDLLRGALDLEESLAMLSSIQEDDSKQKPRICKDGRSDLRFQRSMSDRFGERVEKRMMVQESVASKDCYEELRKVIRESFLRQNLVSQTTTTGIKTRVVRNDFASSSGAASSSTSSSQSSMVSGSTKSSASSDIPRRAPSLIARLMGLDVSTQEPSKSTVNHIDKPDILKLSSERQEKVKKNNKESPEIVRCNSMRETVLQSLPEEIPRENPSTIVLIRPMRVVQPEMEEKPGSKRPVVPKKPRMQGEVHPRMINQRKDHQAKGSNKMKLPLSLTKKDKEPKEMVRKGEENEGKVIKLMSPSNGRTLTRDRKPLETNKTNKKLVVKKEDIAEGKDRHRPHDRALKPPSNPASQKKSNNPSDVSRNKSRRSSRLSSSSSSGSREKKSGEASRPNAKKKLRQQDNNLGSENHSSSQDTLGSLNQLSTEETTSSEFHNQGQCDNGEVSSCAATIHYSHEPEASQISLKSFLSSSSEFINYAEDLFDFNTNTKRSRESNFRNRDNIVISDQRLALDFAKEVARRKSLLLAEQPCHTRSSLHIDEVLMEVCDGFESLGSYKDTFSGQNSFVKETIHLVLEKDLKGKKTEMTSGVWDLGWRSEFQIDETYQAVVVDLEKLILSSLIQEIIS